ncbi:unnamed protein product [Durusdinium trenchii]|uniref:Transmembrane protein n=1 Tax=Durusdinium trenchii TaxID=1381693 RepID=A0ABP0Q6E8_9DINO
MWMELAESEQYFVISTFGLLAVGFMGVARHLVAHCKALRKNLLHRINAIRSPFAPCADRCLRDRIYMEKVLLLRSFFWYFSFVSFCFNISILYNILAGKPRWMTMNATWGVGLIIALAYIPVIFPFVINQRTLDITYLANQLALTLWLGPWCNPAVDNLLMLNVASFLVLSVPVTCSAKSPSAVVLGQSSTLALCVGRALTDDFHGEKPSMSNPRTLVILGAVSSLLGLTCDAVVELDSELKFVSESVQLATMLLHRPGASMQGMKLTDFIAAPDVARAEEVLSQHPSDDVTAHAFHTHLVDSCSSKFRTEIFQVRYTTMNGTPHHLLGLREFTDLKPLARADDPNPAGSPDWHDAGVTGEPTVGNEIVLDCSYKSLDSVSFPLIHSESEEETPVTEQVSSGVVEKRLEITKKDSFFNVDMKEQVVCAASAPFCSLVGLKLHAILGSSFASRMFQKLCEDARRFAKSQSAGEDDQVLPDQVAMFWRMPLLLGAQLVEISGVMKVMLSQSGDLQVIVSFARVESASTRPPQSLEMTPTTTPKRNWSL